MIYNSWGMILAAHEPFTSAEDAITRESDILSDSILVKRTSLRKTVGDTDNGHHLQESIDELRQLLKATETARLLRRNKRRAET